MVEYIEYIGLSKVFRALSDGTRRSLLTRICQDGPCRVTDLASVYDMSLNAVSKHIKVLEKAELIHRKIVGRIHWIEGNLKQVQEAEKYFEQLKSIWELRLNKLDEVISKKGE